MCRKRANAISKRVYYKRVKENRCAHCGHPLDSDTRLCSTCRRSTNDASIKNQRKNKLIAFRHYSNNEVPYCDCCGETELNFLCLDHINGGGGKHRSEIGVAGGHGMYRWIIKNNFPKGYRVLCANCNLSYGIFGHCPHQKEDVNESKKNI